jgi:hypothetical protein
MPFASGNGSRIMPHPSQEEVKTNVEEQEAQPEVNLDDSK